MAKITNFQASIWCLVLCGGVTGPEMPGWITDAGGFWGHIGQIFYVTAWIVIQLYFFVWWVIFLVRAWREDP